MAGESKKKTKHELTLFFPGTSSSGEEKEFFAALKNRTSFVLKGIQGQDTGRQIDRIDGYLLSLYPPQEYSGKDGMEVQFIQKFEQACVVISQRMSRNPRTMNALEYHQALAVIKKQIKAEQKQAKAAKARARKRK